MNSRIKPDQYAPEELMEVAYDFEDVIDDLIMLRSSSKLPRIGNWEKGPLCLSEFIRSWN